MRPLALALCLAVAGAFVALPAVAEDRAEDRQERAARLFDEGGQAFDAGHYREAAALFEEAYALAPHASALANAAESRARAGERAKAANHYERLAEEPGGKEREAAQAALVILGSSLGRIVVHADDATIDDTTAPIGRPFWVEAGEHVVDGHVHGQPARRRVSVRRGRVADVKLQEEPTAGVTTARWLTYLGGAATFAVGGITVWSGLDVLTQKDTFDRTHDNRDLDEGLARQQRTNVLAGVTIGLAVLTGVAAYFAFFRTPERTVAHR